VAMNVGFYYMANAGGRLLGTLLSGLVFQAGGLVACLWVSAILIGLSAVLAAFLPRKPGAADPSLVNRVEWKAEG
jgi:predicted MFS family arabinose efflux permease